MTQTPFPRLPRRKVNGILLLDKPAGLSSNAALQIAKRSFQAEKAGHTGTLDPFATGLLALCFGQATKSSSRLLMADKGYEALIQLGVVTDTADIEGQVLSQRPVNVSLEQVVEVLKQFTGEIMQTPPMFSALKHKGKPLYKYAREGITIKREPRLVTLYKLLPVSLLGEHLAISVECSRGTYIRTLAQDIGEALGCGGHLIALRRTHIGNLSVEHASSLSALEALSLEEKDSLLANIDILG